MAITRTVILLLLITIATGLQVSAPKPGNSITTHSNVDPAHKPSEKTAPVPTPVTKWLDEYACQVRAQRASSTPSGVHSSTILNPLTGITGM